MATASTSSASASATRLQARQRGRAARQEVQEELRFHKADVGSLDCDEADYAAEAANRLLAGGTLAGVTSAAIDGALTQRALFLNTAFVNLAAAAPGVAREDAELQALQEVEATTLVVAILSELRLRDGG